MTTTLKKAKDANRTRKAKAGSAEKMSKEAQAEIAARLEKLEAGEPVGHSEQSEPAKPKETKKPKGAKVSGRKRAAAPKQPKPKRLGVLDAAAQVIVGLKEPIGCKDLVAKVVEKGLWKSPAGKTPEATLYSSIIREIAAKGRESRFKKVDRGMFTSGKVA